MDKERILQTVLTLAVIGSLALVAGAIVTGESSEWNGTQVAAWREAHGEGRSQPAPPPAPADLAAPAPPDAPAAGPEAAAQPPPPAP